MHVPLPTKKSHHKRIVKPSEDAHGSEYVCECDMRRGWLSGFTGSAGTAVVTKTQALLWTDSRYFLSAASQVPTAVF